MRVQHHLSDQVVNKLSVTFADIGKQPVKNIPSPIHAYKLVMTPSDAASTTPRQQSPSGAVGWWPIAIAAAFIGGALFYVLPGWIDGENFQRWAGSLRQ